MAVCILSTRARLHTLPSWWSGRGIDMPRPFRGRSGPVEWEIDTARLNRILDSLPGNRREAVRVTAFAIERKAKPRTRFDTGALRSSIYTRVGRGATPMPAVEGDAVRVELPEPGDDDTAHVGPSVEYGIWQELGTAAMAAQPFLGPAVNEAADELERNFRPVVTGE
jgi:HK97 gp10 family phage protein